MKTYILISALGNVFIIQTLRETFIFSQFHWIHLLFLVALIASTNGLPRRIKRLNNALGIPKESEVLWDILDIGNLTLKVDGFESLLGKIKVT